MKLAIIGGGDWGKNWYKAIKGSEGFQYVGVWDRCPEVREGWQLHGEVFESLNSLLNADYLDGVIVSSSTESHQDLVREALVARKHVIVEKPFGGFESEKSESLFDLSQAQERCLMVDYTFIHGEPFHLLKKSCSEPWSEYFSHRLSPSKYLGESRVIDDLAVHDLSMVFSLCPELKSFQVRCHLEGIESDGGYSGAVINLKNQNVSVKIFISGQWPEKRRDLVLKSSERTYFFNDLDREQPVKIYEREGEHLLLKNVLERSGRSALHRVLDEFKARILSNDYASDLNLVKKINQSRAALYESCANDGCWVSLELKGV